MFIFAYYFYLGIKMKISNLLVPTIVVVSSVCLYGCASSQVESLQNKSPVTYTYNKGDEIKFAFRSEEYCLLDDCSAKYSLSSTCDSDEGLSCEIKSKAANLINYDLKTYKINKNKEEKDKGVVLSFIPAEYSRDTLDSILPFFNSHNPVIDVDDYLSNPKYVRISTSNEFISKYNQESILGNFARKNLFSTNDLKNVTNQVPLVFNVDDATISTNIRTFAYKNGTLVKLEYLDISFKNVSFNRDLTTIKEDAIKVIEDAVKD